jgi:transcription elongation factor Elf1
VTSEKERQEVERELWCPKCGGHNYTQPPGGKVGLSTIEVVCDDCGHRYEFAVNLGAQFARDEWEALQGP